MPNVMSLPNRGDPTLGNNKKKSGGGVDASMITRMKREQAIVSDQRTEPGRYNVSVSITDVAGNGADASGPLTFTFTSPGYVPFVPGEQVAVTGNAGVVTTTTSATASATTAANIVVTLSAAAANGVLTVLSTTSNATLKVGQRLQVASTTGTFGLTDTSVVVYIKAVSGSNITVTTDEAGNTLLGTGAGGATAATLNVTGGGSIITMTYGGGVTTTAPVFLSGDSIAITGHSNTASTGVAIPSSGTETLLTTKNTVLSSTATQVVYQTTATFTAGTLTASNAAVTITPASSRYNGNFNITACTSTTVTMALPAGNGPSILGIFTSGRTGTMTGNRPIGQVFEAIVDKPMTRGFTDGPVMPFFRRSASLGFYRVL